MYIVFGPPLPVMMLLVEVSSPYRVDAAPGAKVLVVLFPVTVLFSMTFQAHLALGTLENSVMM